MSIFNTKDLPPFTFKMALGYSVFGLLVWWGFDWAWYYLLGWLVLIWAAYYSSRKELAATTQSGEVAATPAAAPAVSKPNAYVGEYRFKYWGRDDRLTKRVVFIDSFSQYRDSHYLNGFEDGKGERSFMVDAIDNGEVIDTITNEPVDVEMLLLMLPETPPRFGPDAPGWTEKQSEAV